MNNQIQALLDKIQLDSDPERKYFFIFDIDGTLRPDEVEALDHRHPKIPPTTAQQLKNINLLDNFDIVILTARAYVDIFKSNFPKDIIKYCCYGKQILDNDILRYPREEFRKSYDETVLFIDLIKDLLSKEHVSKIDFLVSPGDFAIYFNETNYEQSKQEIMETVSLLLKNSRRWKTLDFGKEVIFLDNKYHYDKGDAAKDIVDKLNLETLTNVFMFGDSATDVKAMMALREYQKEHPSKRIKVCNISIGKALSDYEFIDFRFGSHHDTIKFIDALHEKVIG